MRASPLVNSFLNTISGFECLHSWQQCFHWYFSTDRPLNLNLRAPRQQSRQHWRLFLFMDLCLLIERSGCVELLRLGPISSFYDCSKGSSLVIHRLVANNPHIVFVLRWEEFLPVCYIIECFSTLRDVAEHVSDYEVTDTLRFTSHWCY
jgi:hypothetical protein